MDTYDEFGLFHENAAEYDLPIDPAPTVRRERVEMPTGLAVSALVWGVGEPDLVLVHGGAQNAHTWDTVALALGRPLVAIDLPGHGHSDHRPAHDYTPTSMAADLAVVIDTLAPRAEAVVGMSLGGMTSICLAADHPHLVRRLGVATDAAPQIYPWMGNIGACGVPTTAALAREQGLTVDGDVVALMGIGSGLNCAMLGVQW